MNTTDTEGLPADTSNEEPSNAPKTYSSISQDPLAHELVVLKEEQSKLREQYIWPYLITLLLSHPIVSLIVD